MFVPLELNQLVTKTSERVGCTLAIIRCWQSDGGRHVYYANVRGVLNESPDLRLEIAGTVCAEMQENRADEINLFLFANGERIGLHSDPTSYLIGHGEESFAWDYNDEGFDQFLELDESTFSHPIDESMVIPAPDTT